MWSMCWTGRCTPGPACQPQGERPCPCQGWQLRAAARNHDRAAQRSSAARRSAPTQSHDERQGVKGGGGGAEKFCRYMEVDERFVHLTNDCYVTDPKKAMAAADENTIGARRSTGRRLSLVLLVSHAPCRLRLAPCSTMSKGFITQPSSHGSSQIAGSASAPCQPQFHGALRMLICPMPCLQSAYSTAGSSSQLACCQA